MMVSIDPSYIFQTAKDNFVSGNYLFAFNLLRESFDANDVSDEQLLGVLHGEIGFDINGDSITFNTDSSDESYFNDVMEVTIIDKTLITKDDTIFCFENYIPMDVSHFSSNNELVRFFKENNETFVKKSDIPFIHSLEDKLYQLMNAQYVLISPTGLFCYTEFCGNIISGVSVMDLPAKTIIDKLTAVFL